jgi:hypothetical protein
MMLASPDWGAFGAAAYTLAFCVGLALVIWATNR